MLGGATRQRLEAFSADVLVSLVALAFPAALWNITAGQNGFLTAALYRRHLLGLLERRPALAGICLGLLTYKPHFGLLFPICWSPTGAGARSSSPPRPQSRSLGCHGVAFGTTTWVSVRACNAADQPHRAWRRRRGICAAANLFGFGLAHGGGEALAWTDWQGGAALSRCARVVSSCWRRRSRSLVGLLSPRAKSSRLALARRRAHRHALSLYLRLRRALPIACHSPSRTYPSRCWCCRAFGHCLRLHGKRNRRAADCRRADPRVPLRRELIGRSAWRGPVSLPHRARAGGAAGALVTRLKLRAYAPLTPRYNGRLHVRQLGASENI